MHEFWTIPTAMMMYTRLQNYTTMVVDEHRIQTCGYCFLYCRLMFSSPQVYIPCCFWTSGLSKYTIISYIWYKCNHKIGWCNLAIPPYIVVFLDHNPLSHCTFLFSTSQQLNWLELRVDKELQKNDKRWKSNDGIFYKSKGKSGRAHFSFINLLIGYI